MNNFVSYSDLNLKKIKDVMLRLNYPIFCFASQVVLFSRLATPSIVWKVLAEPVFKLWSLCL